MCARAHVYVRRGRGGGGEGVKESNAYTLIYGFISWWLGDFHGYTLYCLRTRWWQEERNKKKTKKTRVSEERNEEQGQQRKE